MTWMAGSSPAMTTFHWVYEHAKVERRRFHSRRGRSRRQLPISPQDRMTSAFGSRRLNLPRSYEGPMREPLTKFPKRPTGPEQTRKTIAECKAMLANPRLSPEMRHGLKERVAQLEAELRA